VTKKIDAFPMSDQYHPVQDDVSHEDRTHHPGRKGGTTVAGAVWSIVCTTVGAGIASLPFALGSAGWFGLIMIVIISIFSNSTSKLIAKCMHMVPGKRLKTYEDIGEACFGIVGRRVVAVFQSLTLFGVCTIFLILIGGNMENMVPQLTYHDWAIIFVVPVIPFTWLKTMKEISFIAFFGLMASLIVAMVVVIKGFQAAGENLNQQYDFVQWGGVSNAFNVICFSFGVHAVLPAIEHEMAQPEQYPKVSNLAFSLIGCIYFVVATAGYWGYGNGVAQNVLNSVNLQHPGNAAAKVAYSFITAHVTLAYPLPLNPLGLNIESALGVDRMGGRKEIMWRILVRSLLVFATIIVASAVPYFGDFLSLISALSVVANAFIFPPLFYYVLHRRLFLENVRRGVYRGDLDDMENTVVNGNGEQQRRRLTEGGAGDLSAASVSPGAESDGEGAGEPSSSGSGGPGGAAGGGGGRRRGPLGGIYAEDVAKPLSLPWVFYLVLVMQVGLLGSVIGVYFASQDLHDDIKQNPHPFDNFFVPPPSP